MKYWILIFLMFSIIESSYASKHAYLHVDSISAYQKQTLDSNISNNNLYDIVDLFKDIIPLKSKSNENNIKKRSNISYLPNLNYNPSIGFQLGIKAVGGIYLGEKQNTNMSVFATALNYTTKGIAVGYLFHDIYTKNNSWNFKGSLHIARMVGLDYGLGLGNRLENQSEENIILTNPDRNKYINNYTVYGFSERVYKEVINNLFIGTGVYIDLKRSIKTLGNHDKTPLSIYSSNNNYIASKNNNNGLMFNIQYLTRDNPNSAYKGSYIDLVLRANQTWIGSSSNGIQLLSDIRKYWQLSNTRENHVLAVWYYGAYNVHGDLPYLDLPGTGKDQYARSGRGYTNGYFKGKSYAYGEIEYRFPILRNKFLSGTVFGNLQTVDDAISNSFFKKWQPAGGAGLRVLFNKMTRTNFCIDYAYGKFGQKGLFLGLNEAF